MPSKTKILTDRGLIKPPSFIPTNVHYETMMGSIAYGVSCDKSDVDIYGWCIPPKEVIFPHLTGYIDGFGRQHQRFDQYQKHHIEDKDAGKVYDISMYSIVKFFHLCAENNPNMIDALFTPQFCIQHITKVGQLVRENRKLFLHKGSWHKFKGYAYSQLHKMRSKDPQGKRLEIREKFGYDVKFAYHVVRLLDEVEQILTLGDLDLQRSREHLKAIRRGEVPEEDIYKWFADKEKQLEKVYLESKLRHSPDEPAIKRLLLQCLEEHYGNLGDCIVEPDRYLVAIQDIREIIDAIRDRN